MVHWQNSAVIGLDRDGTKSDTQDFGGSTKHVLVAEADPVTQSALDRLLSGRGHLVNIVADGEQAMSALQAERFDVVLVNFHLPKMDGLQVAATFRSTHENTEKPRFVAITSDMKGLLDHAAGCDNFDEVVAKPFDLDDICHIVEAEPEPAIGEMDYSDDSDLDRDRAFRITVPKEQLETLGDVEPVSGTDWSGSSLHAVSGFDVDFEYLRWPEDFSDAHSSARALRASLGDGSFAAIVVSQPAGDKALSAIWRMKFLHTLPIIDLTGHLGRAADYDGSKGGIQARSQISALVREFDNRRALLHRDFLYTDNIGEKLLSRIFLKGGHLRAGHNPSVRRAIDYDSVLGCDEVEREAGRLLADGLLNQTFFDRLHICDRCRSSRFNIREECAECRSPDLVEEPYLHHFRCAYQGLESDFRDEDSLICPKCRRELTHFSIDYDKPGTMIQCRCCGHKGSDPAVGMLCLDCGSHTDGDRANVIDVYSYDLTEKAIAFLESGHRLYGGDRRPLHLAELPLELIVAINSELGRFKTDGIPFTLLDITYSNARALEIEHGIRQFDQARNLFLENLRSILTKNDCVVRGRVYDFALLAETEPDEARTNLDALSAEAMNTVRLDLGVTMSAYGAETLA